MPQQAQSFQIEISRSIHLNYLLFLPTGYDPAQSWPLILFLHGAGERGDDLEIIKRHGLPKIVSQRPDFPFVVVSPQCPANEWWLDKLEALLALLDQTMAAFTIDPTQVYLTGLSMGGHGAWSLGATHPHRFAAVAPVCGWGTRLLGFPEKVCALKETPVWAFHGAQDEVVRPEESELLVETLRACGGQVRLTLYPQAAHDSWTETYDNPKLYEWLLQHRRPT